jgi:hypothetical protein
MKINNIFRFEQSSIALVLSNIVTIGIALWQKWNISNVMWIYWGQSIIIGYYNWKRIRCLKQFSTENFEIGDKPVEPTKETQKKAASFFAMHYGFFHLGYSVFLCAERGNLSRPDILGIIACIVMFGFNHRFSFNQNLESDLSRKPNIGTIMFFPYARILPMHLTIILGSFFAKKSVGTLLLFLGLKTLTDLIMHLIEHRQNSPSVKPAPSVSQPDKSSETLT